jgi:hypothetical protein
MTTPTDPKEPPASVWFEEKDGAPDFDSWALKCTDYHNFEYVAADRVQRLVEALEEIYFEAQKGDGTTTECSMAYTADDALAAWKDGK